MPLKSVYDDLQALKAVSGKAREQLLKERLEQCSDLREVVRLALDPYKIYYVGAKSLDNLDKIKLTENLPPVNLFNVLSSRNATGHDALRHIKAWLLRRPGEHNEEVLRRILLKDLRCGVSGKTVEKVMPGLVPVYDCMLAHKYDEQRIEKLKAARKGLPFQLVGEPKFDGVRVNVWNASEAKSRNGKPLPAIDHLAEVLQSHGELEHWVLDAEVVSGHFQDTVGSARRKSQQDDNAVLMCFDIIPKDCFLQQKPFRLTLPDRRELLSNAIAELNDPRIQLAEQRLLNSHEEVMAYYNECRDAGLEGIIVKPTHAPYEFKRSYGWLKIKDLQTVDLEVINWEEGTGKYAGMIGALVCKYGDVEVRVGSGLTDADRERDPMDFLATVIEVEYHEKTRDGSLRHPRYKGQRLDKDIEDGPGV